MVNLVSDRHFCAILFNSLNKKGEIFVSSLNNIYSSAIMKTIKIFIASSNELEKERVLMASLANELSTRLEKVGIQVIAVEWESLDASMNEEHKQEEYNEKLRECDMCMVLYWTKFGMYTEKELNTAYHEKIAGKNPQKVWVYFKEVNDPSKMPTEELKKFRDSFPTKYGHFYTPFDNFDTLKAHFLLQFMEYQSQALQGKSIVEVKDGKVTVDGKEYVDLQNVPFAGNNEEYQLLQKNLKKTRKLLAVTEMDDPEYVEYASEIEEMEDKLTKMESSLWDTALMITRLSTTKCSERLQRAMELFSKGDNKGAQAILNEEEIAKDVQHNLNLIKLGEEGKKGLKTNIDEYLLKIQTYENDLEKGWVENSISLYEICIEIGRNNIDEVDFAEILIDYADLLSEQNQYDKVEDIYWEAYSLLKKANTKGLLASCMYSLIDYYITSSNYKKAEETIKEYISLQNKNGDEEELYRYACGKAFLANLYYNQWKYAEALEECEIAISIYKDTERYHTICNYLYLRGIIHKNLGKDVLAEADAKQIITIHKRHNLDNDISNAYNLLGNVYCYRSNYKLAIESYLEALNILENTSRKNPLPYLRDIAITYLNLADNHTFINSYSKAFEELQKARDIFRTLFKQSPLQNAEFYEKCLFTIANHCKNKKDYKQAEEAIDEAIAACRLLADTDAERHLFDLAHSLNIKGIIMYEQGKYKEAEILYNESLSIRRQLVNDFGEEYSERLAQILTNLGLLHCDTKEYEKAEIEDLEAIEIYKSLISKHKANYVEDIAIILLNLGYLYRIQKCWDKAIDHYQESVDIYLRGFKKGNIKNIIFAKQCLSRDYRGIGMAYKQMKKNDLAIQAFNDGFRIIEEQINDENKAILSSDYASVLNEKAWLLYETKEYDEAEPLAQKAVKTIRLLPDLNYPLRMYLDTLACIHRELGKYAEAESEFLESLTIAEDLYSQNAKLNIYCLYNELKELAFLYFEMKDHEKFYQYKAKALHYYNDLNEETKKEREEDCKKLESMTL